MASVTRDGEVLEGFLCPICLEDLVSISQLQVHFEEKHENEDKAGLHAIKGFFSKAKKKFLSDDDVDRGLSLRLRKPFASEADDYETNNPWDWETPYSIPSRSHISNYKRIRSARIDSFVAATNKLLIRLDKLLTQIPSDPVKRKAHEKEIVPWVDNRDVPLCPFCARAFNLARRRHHCRLCGAILCDECSEFLSFSFAEKLISPVHQGSTSSSSVGLQGAEEKSLSGPFGSILGSFHGLRRSSSHSSLNSLMSVVDPFGREQGFRICFHCLSCLKTRDKQVEQRTFKPLLSVYYEKLMDHRRLLLTHIPQYLKMAVSLMAGESTYQLSDAEELRMRILKLSDIINVTAQKIRNLGAAGVALEGQETPTTPDGGKVPAGPRQELLQRRIHSATAGFLKDNVLGLPRLPSKEEVLKKQERRRKETDARLTAEREAAKLAEERAALILRRRKAGEESSRDLPHSQSHSSTNSSLSSNASTPRKKQNEVTIDTGWGADITAHIVTETDDPIVQQMNIIRNYIRQAREASKYDEVSLLEANLKELQLEFKKRELLLEL